MIPYDRIHPAAREALLTYLTDELRRAQQERAGLEASWIRFQELYRAKPATPKKDFPFENAANLVIPVIATDVDTIFAEIMSYIFTPKNLWSVRPLREEMVEVAPRLQEFLQWAQHNELKIYNPVADFILELCKLGTGILKQRYTREQKKVYEWRELDQGNIERFIRRMVKDQPSVHHVSLADFYVPSIATDIQSAPWCAERIGLTWQQLLNRIQAGIYSNELQTISTWWGNRWTPGSRYERAMQAMDGFVPTWADRFELYEFWLDFDIDGDGEPEALVCTIHPETRSYLRIDYNPFFNQEKPYSFARYIRVEKRFYGIGLAEIGDMFQEEITTMHNQRLDNATLANTVGYKALANGRIKQNEPVYPGMVKLLDDMNDFEPFSMGSKYDSTLQNEQATLMYQQRRSGINDLMSGDLGQYATATTTQALVMQGRRRPAQVLREVQGCLSETGTRVLELYQQFNQRGKEYYALGQKDGALVHQVLQFPTELIRLGVGIDLTAADAEANKDVEIRRNQLLFDLVMQFYQQMFMAAQFAQTPGVPAFLQQLALQMIQGGTILARRMLDSFGVQDVDKLIPDLQQAVSNGYQQIGALYGPLNGGAPMGPVPGGPPGVPALPAGAGGIAGGGFPATGGGF